MTATPNTDIVKIVKMTPSKVKKMALRLEFHRLQKNARTLPMELIDIILSYTGKIIKRNGKYMNQLDTSRYTIFGCIIENFDFNTKSMILYRELVVFLRLPHTDDEFTKMLDKTLKPIVDKLTANYFSTNTNIIMSGNLQHIYELFDPYTDRIHRLHRFLAGM